MATVVHGSFEWDDAKAAANLAKHGVSFGERDRIISARPATAREERLYANPSE